jgi:hypothetical protein
MDPTNRGFFNPLISQQGAWTPNVTPNLTGTESAVEVEDMQVDSQTPVTTDQNLTDDVSTAEVDDRLIVITDNRNRLSVIIDLMMAIGDRRIVISNNRLLAITHRMIALNQQLLPCHAKTDALTQEQQRSIKVETDKLVEKSTKLFKELTKLDEESNKLYEEANKLMRQ